MQIGSYRGCFRWTRGRIVADDYQVQGRSRSRVGDARDRRRTRSLERGATGRVVAALFAVAAAAVGVIAAVPAPPASAAPATIGAADWPGFLLDTGHSSYNAAATTITPGNAATLSPAWRWLVPPSTNAGKTTLWASPTVVNGVVYIGAEDGWFFAIDTTTHRRLWSTFLGILVQPPNICGGGTRGIISTARVAPDPTTGALTVYVDSPDGNLYALNAATGATVWRGQVDVPNPPTADYYAWSSPLVANGKVYIGVSAECGTPHVQAGVASFDQATGAKIAYWHDLPGNMIGASVWSSPALASDGSILVSTGSSCDACQPPLALYFESIVRLNPVTLQVLDAWQVPTAEQGFDGDFGGSPTTFTATLDGVPTPMVGACNKGNGIYYGLRQNDLAAGPVWRAKITVGYGYPGSAECDAAAIWNGTTLIEGGGAATTIDGTTYVGSVQALDPATGIPVWQTGLHGTIVGSPTEDGGGVVAAQSFTSDSGVPGLYLLNAATGAVLNFIPTPKSPLFGQAVFAGTDMYLGAGAAFGLADYAVTPPPVVSAASPTVLPTNTVRKVTISGANFTPGTTISISNSATALPVVPLRIHPTTITASVTVPAGVPLGTYSVTVTAPSGLTGICPTCVTVVPAPTLVSISPPAAGLSTVTNVTLTGTNFLKGLKLSSSPGVTFTVTKITSTTIMATMTVASSAWVGPNLPVVVKNGTAGGYGTASAAILSIGVPSAPQSVVATPGHSEAIVTFGAPSSDAGSAITSYTVTAIDSTNPANGGQTATGAAGPITVTGLTNGDSYTFTVLATNVLGAGPESLASNPVTPASGL